MGDETGRGTSWRGLAIATIVYGGLPFLLALVAALVAGFGSPGAARPAAWVIAILPRSVAWGCSSWPA